MIIVFDAQCLLCNGWVKFLLRHDAQGVFRFASIQGTQGSRLLAEAGLKVEGLETLLLVDDEGSWQHTEAILRILRGLGWPWRLALVLRIVPAAWRDAAYRMVARNRYRWFGRSDVCLMPTPEVRARFLD
jgi:predicted DCC family thiol-disulfide oxidoreductase YuxK